MLGLNFSQEAKVFWRKQSDFPKELMSLHGKLKKNSRIQSFLKVSKYILCEVQCGALSHLKNRLANVQNKMGVL